MLFAFCSYICQCYCYWVVTTRFDSIQRPFKSPFGLFGAVYAAAVYFTGIIALIGFQGDNGFAIVSVIVFAFIATIYYYRDVAKTQKFSEDETNIMFKAYVINANYLKISRNARRNRIKKGLLTFWDKVYVSIKLTRNVFVTRKVFVDDGSMNSSKSDVMTSSTYTNEGLTAEEIGEEDEVHDYNLKSIDDV